MSPDCDVIGTIKTLDAKLRRKAEKWPGINNLSVSEMDVIIALDKEKDKKLELKEIEARMFAPQSTIFGIVKKLEQKGMVELGGSSDDKRIRIASLTEKGIDFCRRSEDDRLEDEALLLSGLTEEEKLIFTVLLKKVADTMKMKEK